MDAWRVIVVGAGNLGLRHIQAIAGAVHPVALTVVEPNAASAARVRDMLEGMAQSSIAETQWLEDASAARGTYDVAVLATGSLCRRDCFFALTAHAEVRYCVFEKVLFPRAQDYFDVQQRLREKGIRAYVNCPMRMYPGWQRIRDELKAYTGSVSLYVPGGLWGLACNAIHYVDAMSYLTGDQDAFAFDASGLDARILPSKRPGYIEFTGTLAASSARCPGIRLISEDGTSAPPALHVFTDIAQYRVEEYAGEAFRASEETGWKFERFDFPIFYQSQLTGRLVETLMETGDCPLTGYERAMELQAPYVAAFLRKYNEITGKEEKVCPIT